MYRVKQKKSTKLKIESKTFLLSCVLYTNAEAYQEPSLTSKTYISAKTAKGLQSLYISDVWPNGSKYMLGNSSKKIPYVQAKTKED